MKQLFLTFGAAALLGSTLLFSSCDKVKDEIISKIDPFTYSQTDISFDIPPQLVPIVEIPSPTLQEEININQILRDNGLDVNIDDISSIKLKDATMHLTNGTEETNWTNIDHAEVEVNTDKGLGAGKAWLKAELNIPDEAGQKYSDKTMVFPDVNLKEYLNGEATIVYYRFKLKTRKIALSSMNIQATVRYEFNP